MILVAGICFVTVAWARGALPTVHEWSLKDLWPKNGSGEPPRAAGAAASARLVKNRPHALELPTEVAVRLGVQVVEARKATQPRPLELPGLLTLNPDLVQRVHTYFSGEVVEIGTIDGVPDAGSQHRTLPRQLRYGDPVIKGQLLAVIYSADLGSKKNDLIDALSQLRVHQKHYDELNEIYKKAGASDAMMRAAQRDIEIDLNNVRRAENTLRTYRVPEEDITGLKDEAQRLYEQRGQHDGASDVKRWARVELRAKMDGRVLERNVNLGENITDTTVDLFKIADLNELIVTAKAFEEDLPALRGLKSANSQWRIRLQAEPHSKPLPGRIDVIGYLVDPVEHTVQVRGRVKNENEQLVAGQFVTATIDLPPDSDEVVLPTSALVEDGSESIVFVQPDADKLQYTQRRVVVARRGQDRVFIRSRMRPKDESSGVQTLQPGERVVTSGAIELKAALEDLAATAKQ
jgi:cobalt-zinc-cadmium efflux system membrane fusion protein